MWFFAVALAVTLESVLGTTLLTGADIKYNCEAHPSLTCSPLIENMSDRVVETKEDILRTCPSAIYYATCIEGYQEQCGYEDALHKEYPIEDMATNMKNLVVDFCDPEHHLQKALMDNLECLELSAESIYRTCMYNSSTFGESFKRSLNLPYDDKRQKDMECLMGRVLWQCIPKELLNKCGEEAKDASVEIIERLRIMENICIDIDFEQLEQDVEDFLESSPE